MKRSLVVAGAAAVESFQVLLLTVKNAAYKTSKSDRTILQLRYCHRLANVAVNE